MLDTSLDLAKALRDVLYIEIMGFALGNSRGTGAGEDLIHPTLS